MARAAARPPLFEVRAPARIDLAGGTLDIWPICQLEPRSATVNLAIDRLAVARVRLRRDGRILLRASDRGLRESFPHREALGGRCALPLHIEVAREFAPEGGLEITTRSGVPAGSGLGGSSALLVAMLSATARACSHRLSTPALLRIAVNLEVRVIGAPTGDQDHVGALYGGLSAIHYPPGGTRRRALRTDLAALRRRLVLVYTGKPRKSAANNWAVTRRFIDGDRLVRRHLRAIAAATHAMIAALERGDLDAAGDAMADEWEARRRLVPRMTTPTIERLGRVARAAGARAMKVCGAGGGGCIVFWTDGRRRSAVERAVGAAGGQVLRFAPARNGAQ